MSIEERLLKEVLALRFALSMIKGDLLRDAVDPQTARDHYKVLEQMSLQWEENLKFASLPKRKYEDFHKQNLTTEDRDGNRIRPTCAHCGKPEALCTGDK